MIGDHETAMQRQLVAISCERLSVYGRTAESAGAHERTAQEETPVCALRRRPGVRPVVRLQAWPASARPPSPVTSTMGIRSRADPPLCAAAKRRPAADGAEGTRWTRT